MLTKTTVYAIRTLLLLGGSEPGKLWTPRRIADRLGESPSYLAKVVQHLVRAGILESEKGAKGGVHLVRDPGEIRLLEIVAASQGAILGDFCRGATPAIEPCGFHRASVELHQAITGVLSRWTLEHLLKDPVGVAGPGPLTCLMREANPCRIDSASDGSGIVPLGAR